MSGVTYGGACDRHVATSTNIDVNRSGGGGGGGGEDALQPANNHHLSHHHNEAAPPYEQLRPIQAENRLITAVGVELEDISRDSDEVAVVEVRMHTSVHMRPQTRTRRVVRRSRRHGDTTYRGVRNSFTLRLCK